VFEELQIHQKLVKMLYEIQYPVKDKEVNKKFIELNKKIDSFFNNFNKLASKSFYSGGLTLQLKSDEKLDWRAYRRQVGGLTEILMAEKIEGELMNKIYGDYKTLLLTLDKIGRDYPSYLTSMDTRKKLSDSFFVRTAQNDNILKLSSRIFLRLKSQAAKQAKEIKSLDSLNKDAKLDELKTRLKNEQEEILRLAQSFDFVKYTFELIHNELIDSINQIISDINLLVSQKKRFSAFFDETLLSFKIGAKASKLRKRLLRRVSKQAYKRELKQYKFTDEVLGDFDGYYKQFKTNVKTIENSSKSIRNLRLKLAFSRKSTGLIKKNIEENLKNKSEEINTVLQNINSLPGIAQYPEIKQQLSELNKIILKGILSSAQADSFVGNSIEKCAEIMEHAGKILELIEINNENTLKLLEKEKASETSA